jgi:aminomethyltransferase
VSLASEVFAIRNSAGLSRSTHVTIVRVDGAGALDFLQTASTQSPYMREGRVRHTLLLRDDASVFADAFIVNVDDAFLVLAEGPSEAELVTWLETLRERAGAKNVNVRGTTGDWATFGVDGPYAWELAAGFMGPTTLGQPYLSLSRREDMMCLRAGKTGEYGYLLMVPSANAESAEAKLREIGGPLDLATVTREALDVCALENWHFSMRQLGTTSFIRTTLTPIELQLQWRVVYTREFAGAEALRARRAEGPKARVTCFTSSSPIAPGQRVRLHGLEGDAGEVLASCDSPTLGQTVGSVLLDIRVAHPHITFTAGEHEIRTCTASLVDNQSLRIQPHKHSYASRNDVPA